MGPQEDSPQPDPNAALVVEWFRRYAAGESMRGLVRDDLVAHGSPTFMYPVDTDDPDERARIMRRDGLELELREILGTDPHGRVAYAAVWWQADGSAGSFFAVGRMRAGLIAEVTYVSTRDAALAALHP